MKKLFPLFIFILLPNILLFSQDESKIQDVVEFHGFVNAEFFYDSRQTVSAREREVLLFPAAIVKDSLGKNINEHGSLNMLSFHTRLNTNVKGGEFLGAKTSGKIEFDFLGTSDPVANMIRMRHAFAKMEYEKAEILAGQYWHPMFVTECFPNVVTWGAAVPIHVLSRNPQIRFTFKPIKPIKLTLALLSQRDFISSGPIGNSSSYIKNFRNA